MKESLLARALRYLLYATAIIPLIIFSQYISPFHFGKVVVFRSMVELLAVAYLMLVWHDRSYRPRTNGIFWAFVAFAAAFTVTTIFSSQPYQSFWGTLERMGGLWTFWHYLVYYVMLTSVVRTREHWRHFLDLTVGVGILSALYGFGQKTNIAFFIGSGGRERVFGTIGNAALFAGYQILTLFLALTLFIQPGNTPKRTWLYGVAITVNAIAILMTAVRGSLLGLVAGLFVFTWLLASHYRSPAARKALIVFSAGVALFVAVSLTLKHSAVLEGSRYLRRVTDFSLQTYTVQTRFWAWKAGFQGWAETPKTMLLGWGPENFNVPFSKHFNPKFFAGLGSETLFDRAHNMFVEILVTMGLIGFFAYVNIFVAAFRALAAMLKQAPLARYAVGLIPMLIAYAIHNSFIFDTSANFYVFFSVLGFMSFLISEPDRGMQSQPQQRGSSAVRNAAGMLLMIGAVVLVYKTNIVPAKANYTLTRAIVAGWNNDVGGAVETYRRALAYDVPGKYDYRNRFAQYALEVTNGVKTLTPQHVEILTFAIAEVQKNADDYPLDYLPQLYLSRLNIVLGRQDINSPYNDEALRHSLKALSLSPTFVRTYYEIAQAYLNKKDNATASSYFEKAIALNPEVGLSYWYLGIVELEEGNVRRGLNDVNAALERGYRPQEEDYVRLIGVYLKLNDFPNVVRMYEGLIGLKPGNAQYHASLAVAYSRIGRIDDAVVQAHMAAQIDPIFEREAQAFVQSLGRQW